MKSSLRSKTDFKASRSLHKTCASGTVTGVIGKDMRPGNIWENRELPALKNNPNIDPKTKISTVIFQR